MLQVLGCIVEEHDLALVLVAALICTAGSWATVQLYARVCAATSRERSAWLFLTAVVAGASIWCTHFIAMLGYDPGLPVGFDPVLTITSLLLAMAGVFAGVALAAGPRKRRNPAFGGALVGLAVSAMHYTGMLAYRVQGIVYWDQGYIIASIGLSVAFSAAAFSVVTDKRVPTPRIVAAGLLVVAIVSLHFTGMTAFQVDPMAIDGSYSNPAALRAMALSVAAVGTVILGAGWASNFIDTSARAEASDALNNMSNGLVMVAADGTIQLFNHRVIELFGLKDDDISIGISLKRYLRIVGAKVGWDEARTQRVIDNHAVWMAGDTVFRVDHHFDDGKVLNIACQPVGGGGAIITYDDVTEVRESQKQVAHMAFHDALTGLPNRRRFADEIATLTGERPFAMLMVDLDRFKFVNDTLGHAVGDTLLVAVGQRLRRLCDASDLPFRLGGDEIGVLVTRDRQGAVDLANEIVSALSQPYRIGEDSASVGCSIGIAFADKGHDPAVVQQKADLALYRAKENGRGRVEIYRDGMIEEAAHRRSLENDLGQALEDGQFELHYQPLFDLPDRKLAGFEALIRWRHPERGLISPAQFIPVAEQTGAIIGIGAWVIEEACRQLARWPKHVYVSINVSPIQLLSADILRQLTAALDRHGLTPRRIEIELTETAMVENSLHIASVLSGMRALGVRIAMDDFGTGYSSLAHLREFELDRIKIDRSFINVTAEDGGAAAVVRAVTGMARDLSISTTGEGVESEEQLEKLIALGCGAAQGFLLGKPLDAQSATALLEAEEGVPTTGGTAVSLRTRTARRAYG